MLRVLAELGTVVKGFCAITIDDRVINTNKAMVGMSVMLGVRTGDRLVGIGGLAIGFEGIADIIDYIAVFDFDIRPSVRG